MTKVTIDRALIELAVDAAFSPYCAQDLAILAPALRAALAEPAVERPSDYSYALIDRFLRNNLDDEDYENFSKALEDVYTSPPPPAEPESGVCQTCISLSRAVMLDQTGSA